MVQASLNNLPEISYTGQGDNIKSTNGYYKTEIATLMPPTSYLWARRANTGTGQVIQTLSYQKETMESKLKLDLNPEQNLRNSVIQCIQKNTFMNETLIKKINKN